MEVMHTEFWLKKLKGRSNFKDLSCRKEDTIKMGLKEIERDYRDQF
jgi:hypothetical protein